MQISKRGAYRNRGRKALLYVPLSPEKRRWHEDVNWNKDRKQITIESRWIDAEDGRTTHNYYVDLTLEDIATLIKLIGHAATADDALELRKLLGDSVPDLVKLLACATGFSPMPIDDQ